MKIGVLDSGIGGWSILHQLYLDAPGHDYLYLADQAHAPYSERALEDIIYLTVQNTRWLLDEGCEMIVVACNTATVMAIGELRRQWPHIPIVGTVPAVRPASLTTQVGDTVIVLATQNTVESAYLQNLLQPYRQKTNFQLVGTTALVRAIEQEDWLVARQEIHRRIKPFLDVQGVVLGCTHFPLVIREIQEVVGEDVPLFTPNQGVSKRVIQIAGVASSSGSVEFHSTAHQELQDFWQRMQARLNESAESVRLQVR